MSKRKHPVFDDLTIYLPARAWRGIRLLYVGKSKLFHSEVDRIGMLVNRYKAEYLLDRDNWSKGNYEYYKSQLDALDNLYQEYTSYRLAIAERSAKNGRTAKAKSGDGRIAGKAYGRKGKKRP